MSHDEETSNHKLTLFFEYTEGNVHKQKLVNYTFVLGHGVMDSSHLTRIPPVLHGEGRDAILQEEHIDVLFCLLFSKYIKVILAYFR